jgi:hypothetical protein
MSEQLACYIIENQFGNFEPRSASIVYDKDGRNATLFPQANSMPHLVLKDAQRFLLRHSPEGSLVFVNPVKPSLTLTLADLHEANKEQQ